MDSPRGVQRGEREAKRGRVGGDAEAADLFHNGEAKEAKSAGPVSCETTCLLYELTVQSLRFGDVTRCGGWPAIGCSLRQVGRVS
jgi:hypothetical protein